MSIIDRAREALKDSTPGPWETSQAEYEESTTWIEHKYGDILNHDERGHGHMRENFSWMKRSDAELTALAPELAAAVVHVAKLADEIDAEAVRVAATGNEFYAEALGGFAASIREAIEGVEES